jgi:hypothetical protein
MPGVEGPFLAGFIAGEGHFSIRPNNGGQSWACGFQLVQREDNAALVMAARELADVGHISRRPARRTSQAQVLWTVQAIDDCLGLVRMLDTLPLLGKKAGDFRIWRMAVARWAQLHDERGRWPHLTELARTLCAHRNPRYATNYTRVCVSDEYLEGFLADFASAEGHYGASPEGLVFKWAGWCTRLRPQPVGTDGMACHGPRRTALLSVGVRSPPAAGTSRPHLRVLAAARALHRPLRSYAPHARRSGLRYAPATGITTSTEAPSAHTEAFGVPVSAQNVGRDRERFPHRAVLRRLATRGCP